MKKLTIDTAEILAGKFREEKLEVSGTEPANMKTSIRKLGIMAVYRSLSEGLYGLSLKTPDNKNMFLLINSNSTRGRQHFTIAHELFHLYYDENPQAHFCKGEEERAVSESSADLFASALLMPYAGIIGKISPGEIASRNISIDTAITLGQLYGVSHKTMVRRLKDLKLITSKCADTLFNIRIRREASLRGIDDSLYNPGNKNLIIGQYGMRAKRLFDMEKISEGHYVELLNAIGYGESEDSIGC